MGSFKKSKTTTLGALNMEAKRKIIADATHEAVCSATGTDGFSHCVLYARIGQLLASAFLGNQYHFQCGSLTLVLAPGLVVQHLAEDNGLERGEFHCWFGCDGEIVDLSARHYRRLVDRVAARGETDCVWPAGVAERDYVWSSFSISPNQMAQFEVDGEQTQRLLDSPKAQAWLEEGSAVRVAISEAVKTVGCRFQELGK